MLNLKAKNVGKCYKEHKKIIIVKLYSTSSLQKRQQMKGWVCFGSLEILSVNTFHFTGVATTDCEELNGVLVFELLNQPKKPLVYNKCRRW